MVLTVTPISLAIGGAPCSRPRRIAVPTFGGCSTALITPINMSMQGVAADVEATENNEAYFLRVDLPGFDAEDISIQMANGNLTVSANRQEEGSKDKPAAKYTSRVSFSRSFTLPEDISEDDVSASLDKGVLIITLPKAEPTPKPEPKRIAVQEGPAKGTGTSRDTNTPDADVDAAEDKQPEPEAVEEKCRYRGWGRCSR